MTKLFTCIISTLLTLTSCSETNNSETTDASPRYSGILKVPENRNIPNSRTIDLHYTVLRAKNPSGKHPIIFLQGGPGATALPMVPFFESIPFRNDHDIIVYDARGTGNSGVECTEMGNKYFDIILDDLTVEQEIDATVAASQACSEELDKIGYDKSGYTSVENAADIEALRKHLNYDSLILFGGSYGTRLGLTYLREYKNASSAIFMAHFPLSANLYDNFALNFTTALNTLLSYCEEDDTCSEQYPNLKYDLENVRNELTKTPFVLDYNGRKATINTQDFNFMLQQMLYRRTLAADIPKFIRAFTSNDPEPIKRALNRIEQVIGSISAPVYWSIQAYEELPFNQPENNAPTKLALFVADLEVQRLWHDNRATEIENSPIDSDVPVLIVNGNIDPITPVSNTELSTGLTNVQVVPFKYEGHVIFNNCFYAIADSFLSGQPVKRECAEKSEIRFN